MHSSSTSPESWIGKLVWVFPRDEAGLPISLRAECGIVVDIDTGHRFSDEAHVWIVQVGDNYYRVWDGDIEEVEEWSEEVEGEDGSMEAPERGARGLSGDRPE